MRAYGLILVTTCPYDLTKLKLRHKSTGAPPLGCSQRGRPRGQRIRVSSEIEHRRVGMPPKLVCVHMVCTQGWCDVVGSKVEPPRVSGFTNTGF